MAQSTNGESQRATADVEVVLLDEDGVIVSVNEAWSRFAEENGGEPSRTGVGVSYLEICETAADDRSRAVASAIRTATAGDLPAPVTLRIPCPAPGRPRFFDVLISTRRDLSGNSIGATVTLSEVVAAPTKSGERADGPMDVPDPDDDPPGGWRTGVVTDRPGPDEVDHRLRWARRTTRMVEDVVAGDSQEALGTVLRHAVRGAEGVLALAVMPRDARRARVETVARSGERTSGVEVALGTGVLGDLVRADRPVLLSDCGDGPAVVLAEELSTVLPGGRIGSAVAVPLTTGDGTGDDVLVVVRPTNAPSFVEHDLVLLADFAHHASIAMALDRARADREAFLLMTDHERIAADLHDHVIQELFATGMGLQGLVSRQSRPEDRRRVLAHVDAIDATIRRIRSAIFRIRPGGTAGPALRDQLLLVLTEEQAALGEAVHVDFAASLDDEVPPDLADDVVAVVRESLSNTARHARAGRARVVVDLGDDDLTVEVTDDGVGMAGAGPCSGLASLRRRAERRGGRLALSTPPGGGTRLRWTARLHRG